MDKMPELKPCPFCGGEAKRRNMQVCEDGCESWVECTSCFATTDRLDSPMGLDASGLWNTRADLPKEVDLGAITEAVHSDIFNRTGSKKHTLHSKSIIEATLNNLVALGVIKDKGV